MNDAYISMIMRESKLFSGFSAGECLSLIKILKPKEKSYEKEEILHFEDDKFNHAELIVKGMVVGEKFYYDGQAHLVHTFGPKDIIGLDTYFSSRKTCPITYTASQETTMLLFPFRTLINNKLMPPEHQQKITDNIFRILADENIKNLYKMEVLSKRALRCRIRTFLSIMEKKTGQKTFRIGMDREHLAQYLCVNRTALSDELSKMQKEHLILFEKDKFTVL